MYISEERTAAVLKILDRRGFFADSAAGYGEPGYAHVDCPRGVLLADWNELSKRIADYLESAGFSLEWCDEWIVAHGSDSLAYRTEPNSWDWRPTAVFVDHWCDYATPSDDHGDVIEALAMQDRTHDLVELPEWITDSDLVAAGFSLIDQGYSHYTDNVSRIARQFMDQSNIDAVTYTRGCGSEFRVWVRYAECD